MNHERRLAGVELRAEGDDDASMIRGYAAMFNRYSQDLGGFREIIKPGAFKRFLTSGADAVALLNHDPNFVLGRRSAKTLALKEDARGLNFEILVPNTQVGRDTYKSVKRGDINGASFAFQLAPGDDAWDEGDNDELEDGNGRGRFQRRTIKNFSQVLDVSPVTYPAYSSTSVQARSQVELPNTIPMELRSNIIRARFNASLTPRELANWNIRRLEHVIVKDRRKRLLDQILGS